MSRFPVVDFIKYSMGDPIWGSTVERFLLTYPEFQEYVHVAPMCSREPIPYPNVTTLFESIMHYICSSGVRYDYAYYQWETIYPLISAEHDWTEIVLNIESMRSDSRIQPKKRDIYYGLCSYMIDNGLDHTNVSLSDLKAISEKVNGIGPGCVAWCKKYYTSDDDCVEYTDINFKKGFHKLYNTDSLSDRKKKSEEWRSAGFGRIANLFVQNITYST
jgi:hypothetical protein